jgi:MYXO-CTERM domain-containing protein
MQIRFNLWPGNASFGGNFNPSILPVYEYVDWVSYSSYADGAFTLEWREDFDGDTLPAGWFTGSWSSPKNLSTHDQRNVNLVDGAVVLSLTADDAVGPPGTMPPGTGGATSMPPASSGDDNGCTCSTASSGSPGAWLAALALVVLTRLRRRG